MTKLQMRWADIDNLHHVNNVVYADYAYEAWPALQTAGRLPPGRPIGVTIEFHRPILKSERPVAIESRTEGTVLTQTITALGDDAAAATVTTTFGESTTAVAAEPRARKRTLTVRYADMDRHGEIGLPGLIEFLQEARIPYLAEVLPEVTAGGFVIARTEAEFHRPIVWGSGALNTRAWLTRVGNASFGVHAQVSLDEEVFVEATSVLVAFDATTQRSASFTDAQREKLRAAILE